MHAFNDTSARVQTVTHDSKDKVVNRYALIDDSRRRPSLRLMILLHRAASIEREQWLIRRTKNHFFSLSTTEELVIDLSGTCSALSDSIFGSKARANYNLLPERQVSRKFYLKKFWSLVIQLV